MKNYDFDWQINEFMVYCRSTQLRERTMYSYEQTLRLFERWLSDELKIYSVDKVTENMIRKYINDLQERGKYTFFVNDLSKKKDYPERRRDYRKPVSVTTINNYIRNLRVFFNWLERDYIIFDSMPTILNLPPEVPAEIPLAQIRSKDNVYALNISRSRIDLIISPAFHEDKTPQEEYGTRGPDQLFLVLIEQNTRCIAAVVLIVR